MTARSLEAIFGKAIASCRDPRERRPDESPEEHAERLAELERREAEAEQRRRATVYRGRMTALAGLPIRDEIREVIARGNLTAGGSDALQHVKDFSASDRQFLLLVGAKGVGKTCAVAWWLAEGIGADDDADGFTAPRQNGVFMKAHDFVIQMRAHSDYAQAQRDLLHKQLVALDDLGTERDAEAMRHALYAVVDGRLGSSRKRMIITTNLMPKALVRPDSGNPCMCERTADRLREFGMVRFCKRTKSLRTGSLPGLED